MMPFALNHALEITLIYLLYIDGSAGNQEDAWGAILSNPDEIFKDLEGKQLILSFMLYV